MATRGAYGFRVDGQDIITYNHYDSYPSGLGNDILKELHKIDSDTLNRVARSIKARDFRRVDHPDISVADFFAGKFTNIIDNSGFLAKSSHCEWAYIVNLDEGVLEVYKGLNESPKAPGRYAKRGGPAGSMFYGVALLGTYPLEALPTTFG